MSQKLVQDRTMGQSPGSSHDGEWETLGPVPGMEDLPLIYLLVSHLPEKQLHQWESKIPTLTYNIKEAKLIVGNVLSKKRASFDLRAEELWTEEARTIDDQVRPTKRMRVSKEVHPPPREDNAIVIDSSDGGVAESPQTMSPTRITKSQVSGIIEVEGLPPFKMPDLGNTVTVVNLGWLIDSFKLGHLVSIEPYTVYVGVPIDKPKKAGISADQARISNYFAPTPSASTRNQASSSSAHGCIPASSSSRKPFSDRRSKPDQRMHESPPGLRPKTTSGNTTDDEISLPDPPQWVKDHILYACQRSTPPNPPNAPFIALLSEIKQQRILLQDDVGVRAYSTAIASLAAYPYAIRSAQEITQIPGCSSKTAELWSEYKETGELKIVKEIKLDPHLKVLDLFNDIWGVGPKTAQEFYNKGWRDLDDIVTEGWSTLHKQQQAGVKFYEEFLEPIPRSEVETIAAVIHRHAIRVRDEGVECIIVGGYRRGKDSSGDVDVVLSHRDEDMTMNLARDVTELLYASGWVTHTLTLRETHSHREQQTLPLRHRNPEAHIGFDTLDKSFVVWQDLNFNDPGNPASQTSPTRSHKSLSSNAVDQAKEPRSETKNPNLHRRVDIIVSPWRTVGCAIIGWSGGNTFQRDLRRYVNKVKGWKFDSSGIRQRSGAGLVVDLESPGPGEPDTWQDREKRVFRGMGLNWREPWERCTG